MKNIGQLMKQTQDMQNKMVSMQAELGKIMVEGQAGGSMIIVTMNCEGEVKQVKIDPQLIKLEEIDILEDLVAAAMNDARSKMKVKVADEMAKITGGLKLPAGLQFPF